MVALLAGSAAAIAAPWDEPFAGDPKAIADAAAAVEPGDRSGGLVLLSEARYDLDEEGRQTRTTRVVVRILDREGLENWGSIGASWSPWHQDRAVVRGRAIAPDGSVVDLDPSTLMERRLGGDGDIYWDRMALEGPLPGMAVGSVIETEVKVVEHRTFYESGTVTRHVLLGSSVAEMHRLVLSHPKSLKLKLETWLLDDPPKRKASDGVLTRTWEVTPAPSILDFDPYLPPDQAQYPMVGWATGKSWADVARSYSEQVDAKLSGATELEELAREAAGDAADDRAAAAAALLVWVQEQVRYTGLELGENALVPVAPAETLERGFGDCKDQSTLLVGLLRALGHDAHVALLRASGRMDSSEGLPGLGVFDHAIVVMPGADPIWMDPTNRFQRAGRVAPLIEGRSALIARPGEKGLVKISASDAEDNGWVEVRRLTIQDEGLSSLVEDTVWFGWAEASIREGYTGTTDQLREDFLGQYIDENYEGASLGSWSVTDPDDVTTPFAMRLTSEDASLAWAEDDEAYARLPYGSILRELDEYFFPPENPPDEARTADVHFLGPHHAELRYEIVPPAGYELAEPMEDSDDVAGPLRIQIINETQTDGSVHVRFLMTLSGRGMTAEGLREMRQLTSSTVERDVPWIRFVHRSRALADEGDFLGALEAARDPAAGDASRPGIAHARAADILLEAGIGEAAWMSARAGTEASPDLVRTWRTLAWTLQHDELGRRFGAGWDRAGSIAAYREALEVEPSDWIARADLSIVLEYDPYGFRYGDGADLPGAVTELQTLRKDYRLPTFEDNLLIDLFRTGQFDEFERLADSIGTEGTRSLQVATVALRSGPAKGLTTARRFSSSEDAYSALVESAYADLFAAGHFAASADLLQEISEGRALPEDMTELLTVLRRADEYEVPTKSKKPADAAYRWLAAVMDPRTDREKLEELLAAEAYAGLTDEAVEEMRQVVQGGMLELIDELAVSLEALRRLSMAALQAEVDQVDPKTALVLLTMPDWDPSLQVRIVVVKQGGQWRVLGSEGLWGPAGAEIARRARKDPVEAASMLEFVKRDSPLGLRSLIFIAISESAGESAEVAELSAQMLACAEPAAPCLAEIERLLPAVEDEQLRWLLGWTLGGWYTQVDDFASAERMLRATAEEDAAAVASSLVRVLMLQGKEDEVEPVVLAALTAAKADPERDEAEIELTIRLIREEFSGDLAAAVVTMGELDELAGEEENANNRAWYRLILGEVDDETLRLAQVAGGRGSSFGLHTLATVYAEMDRAPAAREALGQAMAADSRTRPESHDWYVIGRIAEAYGALDAAVATYNRVERPEEWDRDSTWELSSRRLRALGHDPGAR